MPETFTLPTGPRFTSATGAPAVTDVGAGESLRIQAQGQQAVARGLAQVGDATQQVAQQFKKQEEFYDYFNVTTKADGILAEAQQRANESNDPEEVQRIMERAYKDIEAYKGGKDANGQPYFRWASTEDQYGRNLQKRKLGVNAYVAGRQAQLRQNTNRARDNLATQQAFANVDPTNPDTVAAARSWIEMKKNLSPGMLDGVTVDVAIATAKTENRQLDVLLVTRRLDQLKTGNLNPDQINKEMGTLRRSMSELQYLTSADSISLTSEIDTTQKVLENKWANQALLGVQLSDQEAAELKVEAEAIKVQINTLNSLDNTAKLRLVRNVDSIVKQKETAEKYDLETANRNAELKLRKQSEESLLNSVDPNTGVITMPMEDIRKLPGYSSAERLKLMQSIIKGRELSARTQQTAMDRQQEQTEITNLLNEANTYEPTEDSDGSKWIDLMARMNSLPQSVVKTSIVNTLNQKKKTQATKYQDFAKAAKQNVTNLLNLDVDTGVGLGSEKSRDKRLKLIRAEFGGLSHERRNSLAAGLAVQIDEIARTATSTKDFESQVETILQPLRDQEQLVKYYNVYANRREVTRKPQNTINVETQASQIGKRAKPGQKVLINRKTGQIKIVDEQTGKMIELWENGKRVDNAR